MREIYRFLDHLETVGFLWLKENVFFLFLCTRYLYCAYSGLLFLILLTRVTSVLFYKFAYRIDKNK